MLGKLVYSAALLLTAAVQPAAAARSDNTPICDYYAEAKYGNNTLETQLKLMTKIVAFAYAGGNGTVNNASNETTGIFNPGLIGASKTFVYLADFFNGSRNTTNINDQAVAVNWLDGGGVDPLKAYINGTSDTAKIKEGSNQFKLFTHWYVAFGRIFGCTKVEDFIDIKYRTLMPAYVHKFMNLKEEQVAYFINQLILASKFYGFSDQDASTLEKLMNNRYNIRCAPPENNMLNSICFDSSCPLALPKSDCNAYNEINAYGVNDNAKETPGGSSSASSQSDLGGGAIAGIVVGGVAGVGLVIGAIWFFFKKRASRKAALRPDSLAPSQTTSGYPNPSMYSPAMTQSPFDPASQYDASSQGQYDPSRQSQFTYFSQGHDSHTGAGSPPPPGWVEMPPVELQATEITSMPPTSPTMGGSQTKLGYKPDVREAVEMESPPPQHYQWTQADNRDEREKTARNREQPPNH